MGVANRKAAKGGGPHQWRDRLAWGHHRPVKLGVLYRVGYAWAGSTTVSSILKGSRARTACAAPALMMTDCGEKHVLHALDGDLPAALEAEDEGVSGGGVAGHALVGVDGEERDLAAGLLGQGEAGDLASGRSTGRPG